MNYRHIYHAGNRCDVFKHIVLTEVLDYLTQKPTPFFALDTHAGIGLYDLSSTEALKTREADLGIVRFAGSTSMHFQSYRSLVTHAQAHPSSADGINFYPGSPWLIAQCLRADDRLVVCELHPDDAPTLRRHLAHRRNVSVHCRDGYEALQAFLPPPEKRGLVLIDPPFEDRSEFARLVEAVHEAYRRWPQGIFMIWYPIKERPQLWHFHENLIATGIKKQLKVEFIYDDEARSDRLNGAGLIVINPPWQLDRSLTPLLSELHGILKTDHPKSVVSWLVGE